jgi:Protein of unknown function (DUF4058)
MTVLVVRQGDMNRRRAMPAHDWTRVEDGGLFHSFHVLWVAAIAVRLNEILPSDYYALAEKKTLGWEPDVLAIGTGHGNENNGSGLGAFERGSSAGGLLLAEAPPKVEISLTAPPNSKERLVTVRRESDDRVAAIIEIVSPGNKSSSHKLQSFVDKAVEFLEQGVHVHIVDLFPPTPRDPTGLHAEIWNAYAATESPLPTKPLLVASYVAGDEGRAFVQSMAVGDPLPSMSLFLESDFYIPVPLEATYIAAFAGFPRKWREVLTAPAN